MSFYAFTIILFSVVVADSIIKWWEALLFLVLYAGYVITMKFNNELSSWADQFTPWISRNLTRSAKLAEDKKVPEDRADAGNVSLEMDEKQINTSVETSTDSMANGLSPTRQSLIPNGVHVDLDEISIEEVEDTLNSSNIIPPGNPDENIKQVTEHVELVDNPFQWPETRLKQVFHVATFPVVVMFYYTTPDLNKWSHNYWPLTFFTSIVWITGWVYLMVDMATSIGCIVGIKPIVIGLTVLAVGTSFPDFMGSLYSARKGFGKLPVSKKN